MKKFAWPAKGALSTQLARDTFILSCGQFLRIGIQAVYFIFIARTLGPKEYGAFVAIMAMVGIVVPFTGIGSPSLLLKNVTRDKKLLGVYWGNGNLLIGVSGLLCTVALVGVGPAMSGIKLRGAILAVAISELILARMTELASFAWSALGRMANTALLNIYISLSRFIAVVILSLFSHHPTVEQWCVAMLCGSLVCTIYTAISISKLAEISFDLPRLRSELKEGAYFASGSAAATVYNDIDKTMLAKLSDLQSTGIYGAAYRLIDVSMAPIKAMTAAACPEFFRRGHDGLDAVSHYAKHLMKRSVWIGAALSLGLFLFAPCLPYIIGHSFAHSVEALRWLSLLPLLRSFHYFLADALSGAGLNLARTVTQLTVGVINAGLNVYFIRHYSWRGASWTSLLCDALLVVGFAAAMKIGKLRSKQTPVEREAIAA